MSPIFLLLALLAPAPSSSDLPWQDLSLSIERDHATSSDLVTLCRVRVVNRGARTWPGRNVRFEAAAVKGGVVMARERGRFGLSIGPRDTLETLIAFHGHYDRFEVSLLTDAVGSDSKGRRGGGKKTGNRKKGRSPARQ